MTEKQLFDLIRENEDSIFDLQKQINEAKAEYIESSSEFKIGERVRITKPAYTIKKGLFGDGEALLIPEKVEYGYVRFRVVSEGYQGGIEYKLSAEKKDGTISKNTLYYPTTAILTKP